MRRVLGVAVVTIVALVWGSAIGGAAPSKHALPTAGKVVASIPIPAGYGGFSVGAHGVWALTDDVSRLSRIDPARNAVSARITVKPTTPCPEFVCGEPAEGEGVLWVPRASDNAVFRLDPASDKVMAKIPVGAHPTAVALTPGAVWVANGGGDRNGRIEGPSILAHRSRHERGRRHNRARARCHRVLQYVGCRRSGLRLGGRFGPSRGRPDRSRDERDRGEGSPVPRALRPSHRGRARRVGVCR